MTPTDAAALGAAPELIPYQDEPQQMRSGVRGKRGELRMGFERRGRRTALVDLYRQAPLLVQRALYWDEGLPDMACVFVIHTSGSVLQGDRFDIDVRVGPDAMAHVTTQSATRLHAMDANFAAQSTAIDLAPGAYLEYMPGVLIPHAHSRYISQTALTVADDATVLLAEILMPGRKYHDEGELFEYDVFSSSVAARRPGGAALFSEKILFEPSRRPMRAVGAMGEFDVVAYVVLVTPRRYADRILDATEPSFDRQGRLAAGASRLPNDAGVAYRVLGMESEPVRSKVREFWDLTRRTVVGASVPPEFLWR